MRMEQRNGCRVEAPSNGTRHRGHHLMQTYPVAASVTPTRFKQARKRSLNGGPLAPGSVVSELHLDLPLSAGC